MSYHDTVGARKEVRGSQGQSPTRLQALQGATLRSPRSLQTGGGGWARGESLTRPKEGPCLDHREGGSHGAHRHGKSPTRRHEKQPLRHSLSNQEEVGLGDGLTHELQAAMRHAAARESEVHTNHHHHHVCDVNRRTSHPPVRKEMQTVYLDENKAANAAGRVRSENIHLASASARFKCTLIYIIYVHTHKLTHTHTHTLTHSHKHTHTHTHTERE